MKIEEKYQDVLQNIEFVIVRAFRRHPDLSDHGVIRSLEAVADFYAAEVVGRAPRPFGLSSDEQELFGAVREVCDWRLGRLELQSEHGPTKVEPLTLEELKLCLRRLLKSIRMWNREGGTHGYLEFVSRFF